MHSSEQVEEALELHGHGLSAREIGDRLGVSRWTVTNWITKGEIPHSHTPKPRAPRSIWAPNGLCAECGHPAHDPGALPSIYAYLLGLYLGDGNISAYPRSVFRLRVHLDVRYPEILDECAEAMRLVMPSSRVGRYERPCNCYEIGSYSRAWPCLFPQHGAGLKHLRPIRLEEWQVELVQRFPELLLRGLIHSDGCRFINTGRDGWTCPRYSFSNTSEDIHGIFRWCCDLLGVHWTTAPRTTYVSRKEEVAYLDTFIGPKA